MRIFFPFQNERMNITLRIILLFTYRRILFIFILYIATYICLHVHLFYNMLFDFNMCVLFNHSFELPHAYKKYIQIAPIYRGLFAPA